MNSRFITLVTPIWISAYLDVSLFANSQRHAKCLQTLQDEVNRSHETFIKHYLETYTKPALPPTDLGCL